MESRFLASALEATILPVDVQAPLKQDLKDRNFIPSIFSVFKIPCADALGILKTLRHFSTNSGKVGGLPVQAGSILSGAPCSILLEAGFVRIVVRVVVGSGLFETTSAVSQLGDRRTTCRRHGDQDGLDIPRI